jgi:hypothetical protein
MKAKPAVSVSFLRQTGAVSHLLMPITTLRGKQVKVGHNHRPVMTLPMNK